MIANLFEQERAESDYQRAATDTPSLYNREGTHFCRIFDSLFSLPPTASDTIASDTAAATAKLTLAAHFPQEEICEQGQESSARISSYSKHPFHGLAAVAPSPSARLPVSIIVKLYSLIPNDSFSHSWPSCSLRHLLSGTSSQFRFFFLHHHHLHSLDASFLKD